MVCLDDAEALESSQAGLAVAGRLIGGEEGALRLAVATRRPLAVRLARERAAGRVTDLGPAELAFSAGDCEEYLRLARDGEPSAEEVDALMEATEGWPLGIVLAAAGPHAEPRGPSRELLDDYFEEEVLGALDPERRAQILAAAAAPDLDLAAAAGLGAGRRAMFVPARPGGLWARGLPPAVPRVPAPSVRGGDAR